MTLKRMLFELSATPKALVGKPAWEKDGPRCQLLQDALGALSPAVISFGIAKGCLLISGKMGPTKTDLVIENHSEHCEISRFCEKRCKEGLFKQMSRTIMLIAHVEGLLADP